MKTSLITGASSGVGLELAKIHAAQKGDLVLVARSENKLLELKDELERQYNVKVTVLANDLSLPDIPQKVFEAVKAQNIQVDFLINNAGIGDYGFFHETDWVKDEMMIDLNIRAVTRLTKLFLPEMIARRSGKIMIVSSLAGFQPGPLMAVYFATKAYLLHFSEALANEVKDFGVTITTLCPGATDTGFQTAADMKDSKIAKADGLQTAKEVAEVGYKAMLKGKTVAIPGLKNNLLAFLTRFLPRKTLTQIVRNTQERNT